MLLTNPGERLFLPQFGGGVRRLVFEGLYESAAAMTKASLTRAISKWLGHRLTLQALQVSVENETIEVEIKYRLVGASKEDTRIIRFLRKGGM